MDHTVEEGESSSSDGFTARHVAISVIPHFTGLLSVLGSLWIIIDILRDRRKKLQRTYHRTMLGMSLSDVMGSAAMALSTWPLPSEDSGVVDGGSVFAASGTQGTCTAQGFFVQVGMAAPLYSGFLAFYYVLMVKYNVNEQSKKMRLMEIIFHLLVWLLALGTSFASLGLDLFNSANIFCWIAPLPLDCISSAKAPSGNGTCVRGDNAWVYRLAFYFIWIWISLICVTIFMAMVFQTVRLVDRVNIPLLLMEYSRHSRKYNLLWLLFDMQVYSQTRRMRRYNHNGVTSSAQDKKVHRVAMQAAMYVGAFYLTIIFPSVARMAQARWNCTSEFFPLSILTVTFYPLQGFWNCFIYMRPRYLRYKKEHKDWSMFQATLAAFQRTLCCTARDEFEDTTRLENDRTNSTPVVSGNTATSNTALSSQPSIGSDRYAQGVEQKTADEEVSVAANNEATHADNG
jgi:hypothetical protein